MTDAFDKAADALNEIDAYVTEKRQELLDAQRKFAIYGVNAGQYQIIISPYAYRKAGEELREKEVSRGGFWQRMFDPDPTIPLWIKTKKVMLKYPHMEPCIYMIGNQIICPQELYEEMTRQFHNE
jgi:hypothetical protein